MTTTEQLVKQHADLETAFDTLGSISEQLQAHTAAKAICSGKTDAQIASAYESARAVCSNGVNIPVIPR